MRRVKVTWIGPASVCAAILASAGCLGNIGSAPGGGSDTDDGSNGPPDNPLTFTCVEGADPSAADMRRLSMAQYKNTLRELLAPLGGEAEAVFATVDTGAALVPDDVTDKEHDYLQMDQNVSQAHVDGFYQAGRAFGAAVTATTDRTAAFVGACATDADTSNDAACIQTFIERFGMQALRRPLTSDEVAFYRDEIYAVAGPIDPRGIVDVIAAMLMAPQFNFHVENGGAPVDGRDDLYTLTGFELAARLSYHFWQSMPDAELMRAAASGELDTEAGYQAQLDRVFADARTQAAIDGFYEQWLGLDKLPDMSAEIARPDYQAFAGADLPTADLREHMIDDAKDLLRYYTWQSEGTFDDLLLSDRSFAKTEDVARLYGGVPLWVEGTEPQALPPGERAGILTRPAMVANNKKTTRPIQKGAFVRKRLLCDKLELPMNMNNMSSNLEVDSELSTRQRVEGLTERAGTACAGCHTQLNPLGYATENYDALGRVRSEEVLTDGAGNVLATVPIDTSAVSRVKGDDARVVADGVALSEVVAESEKAHACFARHYFRYTTGRREDFEADGCVLEGLRKGIVEGGSLREMLRDIAVQREFRLRKRGA